MSALKTGLLVLAIASLGIGGCASGPPHRREMVIERWSENHPEAARELGAWVQSFPQAAPRFFEWDGHHPGKAKEFVTWTIMNPSANIDAFVATHPGMMLFDRIAESHRPGAEAFMSWCRRHPQAAEALMNHPGGLDWAGRHLYATYWHMEGQ